MSDGPEFAQLQRWSDEVARDPDSLAFLPLARAYRRQGRREAALRLCSRGLTRYPTHVEGHVLMALLHMEGGEREEARDAWATVLRLDPDSFQANRGMGFVCLDAGDYPAARRYLARARELRSSDPAVSEALEVLQTWASGQSEEPVIPEPPVPTELQVQPADGGDGDDSEERDPSRVFEPLRREKPFLGAVIVDVRGLVLAGNIGHDPARGENLAAVLGSSAQEGVRAAQLLVLGQLRGIMLETEFAVLHMSRLADDLLLLLAARRDAPAGWVFRTAERAAQLGRDFVQVASS